MANSRETRAEYQARWRREHPRAWERAKQADYARKAALERLADMYPDLFERLVNEERAARKIAPLYTIPSGRPPARRQLDKK